jgi:hypothetical protein
MSDEELIDYLGLGDESTAAQIIAKIAPEKRAVYERMAQVEFEIKLWQEGVAPKPAGVIPCGPREVKEAGE